VSAPASVYATGLLKLICPTVTGASIVIVRGAVMPAMKFADPSVVSGRMPRQFMCCDQFPFASRFQFACAPR